MPTRRILLILCLCWPVAVSAQNRVTMDTLARQVTASVRPSATLYLRTSKDIYETREDVWFRAFVLDAQSFTPFAGDANLYVRLVHAQKDSLVWKEIYPIQQGGVNGHIYLDPGLPEGVYWLEAYSARSVPERDHAFRSLRKITVTRDINAFRKPRTTRRKAGGVRLSFFPEGGNLVAELSNRLAFKAVDSTGGPVAVSGVLLEDGKPLFPIRSTHEGMGSFVFRPERSKRYRVAVNQAPDTLSLPEMQAEGWTLSADTRDTLFVRINHSAGIPRQRVYCRVQIRGMVQAIASGMAGDELRIAFPVQHMPQGIAEVTVFDEQRRPLAERLVYLHPDRQLKIHTRLAKTAFGSREKVSLTIRTTDEQGKPVSADLAVSISDDLYGLADGQDILTHCYLSTQLRGRIVNPQYYFDPTNTGRREALDLLLLTQGWRRYVWDQNRGPAQPVVTDTLAVHVVSSKKKIARMPAVLAFDRPENGNREFLMPDASGQILLPPATLAIGRRIYLKCLGNEEVSLRADDPFRAIAAYRKTTLPVYPEVILPGDEAPELPRTGVFGKTLLDVVIRAKNGPGGFRDKYLGQLDSLAKLEGNTDYVGQCGILNCPAGDRKGKPVEGREYTEYIGNRRSEINTHPYAFSGNEMRRVVYHYPVFTEEELLEKFRLTRIQGYYPAKEFYEPAYDTEPSSVSDFRNTLLWRPVLTTNGEVTVDFYTSDIDSSFTGIVEGIGNGGLPGMTTFHFTVKK
jgi:hypothetical protein